MSTLNALILCGGQSSRLGFSKFKIIKEGLPIYKFWIQQLEDLCSTCYISCKTIHKSEIDHPFIFSDIDENAGPIEGIFRAFESFPKSNWLVIACDLVYVSKPDFLKLINNNDENYQAIAFKNPETHEAFPLLTIYNYQILSELITEYNSHTRSPKILLNNSNIKLLESDNPIILKGINTQEEYRIWKKSDFERSS